MTEANVLPQSTISELYIKSSSNAPRLRIGLLVDSYNLLSVYRAILNDVVSSDFVDLVLVVENAERPLAGVQQSNKLTRYGHKLVTKEKRRTLLYDLYAKYDKKQTLPWDPLATVDCSDLLEGVDVLPVVPERRKYVQRLDKSDLERIYEYDLDVLLRFGFDILKGDILTAARYGVWSYHHGDNDMYRGGPPLLWELIEKNPCSGVILQALTERLDDGVVLCKAIFSTNQGIRRKPNTYYPYWGAAHFVIRALHTLHEKDWNALLASAPSPVRDTRKPAIYRAPSNQKMVAWLAPEVLRRIAKGWRTRKQVHNWQICLRKAGEPRLPVVPGAPFDSGVWLNPPNGQYYADPFLLRVAGQSWLFFEDYIYQEERGRISACPVDSDLNVGEVVPVLDVAAHLSYPAVFEHDGDIFMIPESGAAGEVALYRAKEFPNTWHKERVLFRGSAVDTTPLYYDGFWYFFTTLSVPKGNSFFGALFYSETLDGDWRFHEDAPISTDVRNARSAGHVLNTGSTLLRPVQDCGGGYGRGIRFYRIDELSPYQFRQTETTRVEASQASGFEGIHTYAFGSGVEVVDALQHVARRDGGDRTR